MKRTLGIILSFVFALIFFGVLVYVGGWGNTLNRWGLAC